MKRKHHAGIVLLWMILLIMAGAVVYLSVQDGMQAKELGMDVIRYLSDKRHPGVSSTEEELTQTAYVVRQLGRIGIFFLIGVCGTLAVHLSCKKGGWFVKTGITAAVLLAFACLTEKVKNYIPSRHYSYEEMMMSVAAVSLGFLIVTCFALIIQMMKGLRRLIVAAHSP